MKVDQIVKRFSGILCIHNDLNVYSKSKKEYDVNLINLLQEASNNDHMLNRRMCQIKCPQITYGIILARKAWNPTLKRLKESQKCPTSDVQAVITRHANFYETIHSTPLT